MVAPGGWISACTVDMVVVVAVVDARVACVISQKCVPRDTAQVRFVMPVVGGATAHIDPPQMAGWLCVYCEIPRRREEGARRCDTFFRMVAESRRAWGSKGSVKRDPPHT